jgi:hypothetical protein
MPGEQQAVEQTTENQCQAAKDRPAEGRNTCLFLLGSLAAR